MEEKGDYFSPFFNMNMGIFFNCYIELDSVKLVYSDSKENKNSIDLISENSIHWEIVDEDKLDICYYAFIVNERFWICDTNNCDIVDKFGGFFSKYSSLLLPKEKTKLQVVKDLNCSDFTRNTLDPINPKSVFNNLDYAICYWSEISGVTKKSLLIFQVIDPKGNLYFMDHELLQKNSGNGIRNYYGIIKISSNLISGEWTFRLIYRNYILSSKKVIYNILKNSYENKDTHFSNHISFRIDLKT